MGVKVTVPSRLTCHVPSEVVRVWFTAGVLGSRSSVVGSRVAPGLALSLAAGLKLTEFRPSLPYVGEVAVSLTAVGAPMVWVGLTATVMVAVALKPLLSVIA